MPQLITNGNELIRINPANNHIEYSTNRGITWMSRYSGSTCGVFRDLLPYNGKMIALTDMGVYYSSNKGIISTNEGISWMRRR